MINHMDNGTMFGMNMGMGIGMLGIFMLVLGIGMAIGYFIGKRR